MIIHVSTITIGLLGFLLLNSSYSSNDSNLYYIFYKIHSVFKCQDNWGMITGCLMNPIPAKTLALDLMRRLAFGQSVFNVFTERGYST